MNFDSININKEHKHLGQLKSLFIKYRSVIRFTVVFLSVYVALSFTYKIYLDYSINTEPYPDYITNLVANQSIYIFSALDYRAKVVNHPDEASLKLIINNKFVARVVEGCNSVSVIILFISFVIAFSEKFRSTLFFIIAGSTLLYSVNLIRIVVLSIGLYYYPWRRDILHTVIFPLIIYGMVFILWMLWINHFASNSKK